MAWTVFVNSTTADANQVNGNFTFAQGDLVPHSQGTQADNQFKLGTSTARWAAALINSINASNIVATGSLNSFGHGAPSQTLDINGNAYVVGGNVYVNKTQANGEGPQLLLRNNASSALSNSVSMIFATDGGGAASNSTRITVVNTNAGSGANDTVFYQHSGGGVVSERLRVTSAGLLGVNNSAPSITVDVIGRGSFTQNTSGVAVLAIQNVNSSGSTLLTLTDNLSGGGTPFYLQYSNSSSATPNVSDLAGIGAVRLWAYSSISVYLANNGVGINHSHPSQTLDVKGNLAVASDTSILGHLSVTGQVGIGATLTGAYIRGSNLLSSGELDAAGQPEACIFINTASVLLAAGALNSITAWSKGYDTHSMFTSTQLGRLYAATSGTYLIAFSYNAAFSSAVGYSEFYITRFEVATSLPTTVIKQRCTIYPTSVAAVHYNVACNVLRMAPGDYLNLQVITDVGGFLSGGDTTTATRLTLQKLF